MPLSFLTCLSPSFPLFSCVVVLPLLRRVGKGYRYGDGQQGIDYLSTHIANEGLFTSKPLEDRAQDHRAAIRYKLKRIAQVSRHHHSPPEDSGASEFGVRVMGVCIVR